MMCYECGRSNTNVLPLRMLCCSTSYAAISMTDTNDDDQTDDNRRQLLRKGLTLCFHDNIRDGSFVGQKHAGSSIITGLSAGDLYGFSFMAVV